MKNNKIINKYILSKLTKNIKVFLPGLAIVIFAWCAESKMNAEYKNKSDYHFQISSFATAAFLASVIFWVLSERKSANKFAKTVTKSYLKQAIQEQPELKMFQEIFSNERAIQDIANTLSNSLRPSEKKIVLNIVNEMPEQPTKSEIVSTIAKIKPVIKGHLDLHPELSLFGEMSAAHNTYVWPMKQYVK